MAKYKLDPEVLEASYGRIVKIYGVENLKDKAKNIYAPFAEYVDEDPVFAKVVDAGREWQKTINSLVPEVDIYLKSVDAGIDTDAYHKKTNKVNNTVAKDGSFGAKKAGNSLASL